MAQPAHKRKEEYTKRLAKRLGMSVEQYLNAKAGLSGKKLANHPVAVERREQRKADVRSRRRQAEDDKARQKAEFIARHPWFDPALPKQERYRTRYRLDPEFKLKETLRAQLKKKRKGLAGNWAYSLRKALVCGGNVPSMERLLGFSMAELRNHIERQFTHGMDWSRLMAGDIHIDHIRPLASFDMTNDDDVRAAWALTNLRPMWAVDNMKKGSKVLHLV
jgi:hypothetical protein